MAGIFSIFSNQITLLSIIAVLAMVVFYMYNHFKPEKYVELLRPRDGRGKRLPIAIESDLGLSTAKVGGVVYHFFKVGRAWIFNVGGKMVTKFFGIEGIAYTGVAKGDAIVEISVSDYLKSLWTEKFYNQIPSRQRRIVESDVVGVTIDIGQIDTKALGLEQLTSDNITDEQDAQMLKKIAAGQEKTRGQNLYQFLIPLALGMAAMYFIIKQGFL